MSALTPLLLVGLRLWPGLTRGLKAPGSRHTCQTRLRELTAKARGSSGFFFRLATSYAG